jgi:hypothetical protein
MVNSYHTGESKRGCSIFTRRLSLGWVCIFSFLRSEACTGKGGARKSYFFLWYRPKTHAENILNTLQFSGMAGPVQNNFVILGNKFGVPPPVHAALTSITAHSSPSLLSPDSGQFVGLEIKSFAECSSDVALADT